MTSLMRTSAALFLLATITAAASPADAATTHLTDPKGDADGNTSVQPGFDITGADVTNGAHRIKAVVHFAALTRGDLVVSLSVAHGAGVRIVSDRRAHGQVVSYVLAGSFADADQATEARVSCHGLRVHWSKSAATARIAMPARCLDGGDYRAVRFALLTEEPKYGDSDYAPGDSGTQSAPVARG